MVCSVSEFIVGFHVATVRLVKGKLLRSTICKPTVPLSVVT